MRRATQFKGFSLLLFAKEPVVGRVKTRLGQAIGMELAAELAKALLQDTLRLARAAAEAAGARLVVVHAPDVISKGLAGEIEAAGGSALAQGEGDLGQRLARGLGRVDGARIALGMDSPDLPAAAVVCAFEHLESPGSAVLGPCGDGGYYLLGLGAGVGSEFLGEGIRWSTEHTLDDTRAAMAARGLEPILLASHSDVDELEDLRRLARRLESNPESAPATRGWLEMHPSVLAR